ncbi:hypothetical protein [Bradyrhizobium sp. Tv2a-2]|uniref:hypothetical protein n=1 Tax=Bradyrhizobium sp. Tv2a-2 TaxID=113395 RepID=UPI0004191E2E|nr:hypothetical protein [Bradyrhizobium sp. Tv2a-2]
MQIKISHLAGDGELETHPRRSIRQAKEDAAKHSRRYNGVFLVHSGDKIVSIFANGTEIKTGA